jgi:FKBP-type peptidyl-prolyl cis-trans isomerase SlpA
MSSVQAGSFLTLHYRLSGEDGSDFVNTFHDKPATLSLGAGQLSEALEQRLLGLEEGCRASFELAPGEAFGPRDAQRMQWVARQALDKLGDPLERYRVGDVVQFPTPEGTGQFAGAVRQVRQDDNGEVILFDFNHPLAGMALRFEVQLIGVL